MFLGPTYLVLMSLNKMSQQYTGIDVFRSNIFSTNELYQNVPTLACWGNFMDDYKAKKAKIGQNALKITKKQISNGIFSTENCNETSKLNFLDVTHLVSIFCGN